MNDYQRGMRDAQRFDVVRQTNGGWVVSFVDNNAAECHLIEPVTDKYLDGLKAGGATVIRPFERRVSNIDKLFDKLLADIAYVMA